MVETDIDPTGYITGQMVPPIKFNAAAFGGVIEPFIKFSLKVFAIAQGIAGISQFEPPDYRPPPLRVHLPHTSIAERLQHCLDADRF